MLFNTFEFIIFISIILTIYYIPFLKKLQVLVLIIGSFIFYAWSNIELLILLLFSISINILSTYKVQNSKKPKLWSILGVILNLSILSFFKYSPLFASTFTLGSSLEEFLVNLPLPIGISFFTFQGISLVLDTYSDKLVSKKQKKNIHIIRYSQNITLFIAFFPQLVAGPIVKAHHFLPQIRIKSIKNILLEKYFRNIVLGYFLKMVIADNLKNHTFWIEYPYFITRSSIELIVMLFGYSFQIFADFAGYSLIAIGIAGLFGYNLRDNFNFPYISSSFSEFWQRWHISLSSFLKEYLYIPLGGNRKGKLRTYLNLIIVMFLGGLWHGAAWSYAVWGLAHGTALAFERLLRKYICVKYTFVKVIQVLLIFTYVSLAWLLFKLPNFSEVILYLQSIYQNLYFPVNYHLLLFIAIYSLPVILYHLYYCSKKYLPKYWSDKFEIFIYAFMIFMILTNSGTQGDFIYFQF